MDETQRVTAAATRIADAIGRKDIATLARQLTPDFLFRAPGEAGRDAATFLDAIEQIPGEVVFVKLVNLTVDVDDDSAVATGFQHAQVVLEGTTVDDKRPFVDWFVKHQGEWRLRLALELPALAESSPPRTAPAD